MAELQRVYFYSVHSTIFRNDRKQENETRQNDIMNLTPRQQINDIFRFQKVLFELNSDTHINFP